MSVGYEVVPRDRRLRGTEALVHENLHLGSGEHPAPGWLNVDVDPKRPCQVLSDGFRLSFRSRTFRRVYLGHVLEHVRWENLPAFGAEIRRVSVPGARVAIVGPDIARAVKTDQPKDLLLAVIGEGDGPEAHQWIATEEFTVRAAEACGLMNVRPVPVSSVAPPEWPNPAAYDSWQCAMLAEVP